MSYADQYKAARAKIVSHISTAWSPAKQHYGTVEILATEALLPASSILKEPGTELGPQSPTINEALERLMVAGVWARPENENLEDFVLDRFEELRTLLDTDNHLTNTVTECRVSSWDYDIPSGVDPNSKRVYVYLTVNLEMPYNRDGS